MSFGKWVLTKIDPKHESIREELREAINRSKQDSVDFTRTMVLNSEEIKAAICQQQQIK
jgi:hypothetical protein